MVNAEKRDTGGLVYTFEFENEQVFHLKNFYKYVYEWLQEEGFEGYPSKEPEVLYAEKRMIGGMRENRVWWRYKMQPDDKNKRVMYYLDVDWLILAITDTQAVVGGEKMKAQKADVTIKVKAYMRFDAEDIKKNKVFSIPFFKGFFTKYEKRYNKPVIEGFQKELADVMKRMQEDMKNFLGMQSFSQPSETFVPKKGL